MSTTEIASPLNVVEELERLRTEGTICAWEMGSTTGKDARVKVYCVHEDVKKPGWYMSQEPSQSCCPEAFLEMLQDLIQEVEKAS